MAAQPKGLRSVKPRATAPLTVTEAARSGTTRELFVAMRARIAAEVDSGETPARDLSSLTKRLIEVVRDIEAIDAEAQKDSISDRSRPEPFDSAAI